MTPKDYKEIATIIKNGGATPNPITLAYNLADYFEKEDEQLATIKDDICYENEIPSTIKGQRDFNRNQFLKDCGAD